MTLVPPTRLHETGAAACAHFPQYISTTFHTLLHTLHTLTPPYHGIFVVMLRIGLLPRESMQQMHTTAPSARRVTPLLIWLHNQVWYKWRKNKQRWLQRLKHPPCLWDEMCRRRGDAEERMVLLNHVHEWGDCVHCCYNSVQVYMNSTLRWYTSGIVSGVYTMSLDVQQSVWKRGVSQRVW